MTSKSNELIILHSDTASKIFKIPEKKLIYTTDNSKIYTTRAEFDVLDINLSIYDDHKNTAFTLINRYRNILLTAKVIELEYSDLLKSKELEIVKTQDFKKLLYVSTLYCDEIYILSQLSHKNIISPKFTYIKNNKLYILYKYYKHSLWEIFYDYKYKNKIKFIKKIIFNIVSGVKYLHNNNIIHRDLKPGNILLNSTNYKTKDFHELIDVCDIVITDFGACGRNKNNIYVDHDFTTYIYSSPEDIKGLAYSDKLDIYSIGCIFVYLLIDKPLYTYTPPFRPKKSGESSSDYNNLRHKNFIKNLKIEHKLTDIMFNSKYHSKSSILHNQKKILKALDMLDDNGKALLKSMLSYNEKNRISATKILDHSWFK